MQVLDNVGSTLEVGILRFDLVKFGVGSVVSRDDVRLICGFGRGVEMLAISLLNCRGVRLDEGAGVVSGELGSIDQLLSVGVEGVAPLALGKVERLDGERVDVSELRVNAVGDGLGSLERVVEEVLAVTVGSSEDGVRLDGRLSKAERIRDERHRSDLLECLAVVESSLGGGRGVDAVCGRSGLSSGRHSYNYAEIRPVVVAMVVEIGEGR